MIPVLSVPRVKNLILADDDADDLILLREVVDNHDYPPAVISVADGSQLLRAIDAGLLPDLVVLDLNMPNKNGIECLAEIRANPNCKDLPIVVLSTSKDIRDIELCYTNGAHLFFSKPYTFESLKNLIHYVISIDWKNFPQELSKSDFLKIATEGVSVCFTID